MLDVGKPTLHVPPHDCLRRSQPAVVVLLRPLKETSLSNSLYANTGRAIDLGSDGTTGVALVEFYDLRN